MRRRWVRWTLLAVLVPIAIGSDGQWLAAGSETGEVALWKLTPR
jgi:hypothetical protein